MTQLLSERLATLPQVPADPLYSEKAAFDADPSTDKALLCIGAYRDAKGQPYLLPSVMAAERWYQAELDEGRESKEYDNMRGHAGLCDESMRLLYGSDTPDLGRVASAMTVSGTGALRCAGELLRDSFGPDVPVLLPTPTYANHDPSMRSAGLKNISHHPYYDAATRSVDVDGMVAALRAAPRGTVVILQACAHNPTGADPTQEQWVTICDAMEAMGHVPLFDVAYLGFASGDIDRDAFAPRLFARRGFCVLSCLSFSKNMGMYGDRLGCLGVMCADAATAARTQVYLDTKIIRVMYSSPPRRPQRVALKILQDPALRQQWMEDLKGLSDRIVAMRKIIYSELQRRGTPGNWEHIVKQIGMFSYLGLNTKRHVAIKKASYYILPTGRTNIAGLSAPQAERFAELIDMVVRDPSLDE